MLGFNKMKIIEKNDEIGQMFVSGALDDTKKARKAGADIFSKSGPEQKPKKSGKNKNISRTFLVFLVELAKNP